MSKILFISNISNKITSFVTASIDAAHSLNLDFYQAANWEDAEKSQIEIDEQIYDIKIKSVPISRNPLAKTNVTAYRQLVAFIKQEGIDYIHCNTPVGGLLGRLAGKKCNVKKVIYQAHGFHFYNGAPPKNWLIYYPIEKWLARYTDAIITINKEDYDLAKKSLKLRSESNVYYVPGVGINTNVCKLSAVERNNKRAELGLFEEDFAFVSVGRLEANKNNKTIIKALSYVNDSRVKLILCGDGEEMTELKALSESLGVENRVIFLGVRNDMEGIYEAVDALVMASLREGLSRTVMEAMSHGLPCVVSNIRGNVDLIENNINGFCCDPMNDKDFSNSMKAIINDKNLYNNMRASNLIKIKNFDFNIVKENLRKIYNRIFFGLGD